MTKKALFLLGILILAVVFFSLKRRQSVVPDTTPSISPVAPAETLAAPAVVSPPVEKPAPTPKLVVKKTTAVAAPLAPATPPPPVAIHKELIPKNIEIVRVYYANQITGPDTEIEFDINGSGFTNEFQKMITVESGSPSVQIKNLQLVTLNQIHGTLVVGAKTPTSVSFPQILIQGKVVFRASEPFAVIRPGEVLNVILTEMGETGRTGRIRIFTNLTPEMFPLMQVMSSTPTINITDIVPTLPYVVDATIDTGWHAAGGEYDLLVKLGAVTIFERKGFVRIVRPNVGQTGLAQQIRAADGYHRPDDIAKFVVMGSGFLQEDAARITARIANFPPTKATFTYIGPGKMEMSLPIPKDAKPGTYSVDLMSGDTVLLSVPNLFVIVAKNWLRAVGVSVPLVPGGRSVLQLIGRDIDKRFIYDMKIEADEPGLKLESLRWVDSGKAEADISAADNVAPGDYLLRLTRSGTLITPAFGSIVRVEKRNTP